MSTRAPQPTRDAPRCMALFGAALLTLALSNCTLFPPTPPQLGTLITARDTVADRNGVRHLTREKRMRRTCERSCCHPCCAGPKLCGPRRRDRGEVSEVEKCPPRHEMRRQTFALRAQSGDSNEHAYGKNKCEWLCIEWVRERYSGQSALPPPATSGRRPRIEWGKGPCWRSPCVDKLHGGRWRAGWFDGRSCPRLMAIEVLRLWRKQLCTWFHVRDGTPKVFRRYIPPSRRYTVTRFATANRPQTHTCPEACELYQKISCDRDFPGLPRRVGRFGRR